MTDHQPGGSGLGFSLDTNDTPVPNRGAGGATYVNDGFSPSQYDADLTMDGTAQSVALATGVGKVKVVNRGATTEAIRFAFGTSALNAESNLNIAAAEATTGDYIPSIADGEPADPYKVPALATHYAVANAVALDVQVVSITQGV